MRILSGLTGKMAPVAGPPAKVVPTSFATFTTVHSRVAAVVQRRRGDSRGREGQQQTRTAVFPHSSSAAARDDEPCDTGGAGTTGSCTMKGGAAEELLACSMNSSSYRRDNESSNRQDSVEQQQTACSSSSRNRDSEIPQLNRKSRDAVEHQRHVAIRSSTSRVRQYRKRVCVRWGSLQWSLALVLVVRSAATGCQGATHYHHQDAAAAAPCTLTVA